MIEFNAQTGGRYTYVDDIVNLQELALAFSSIFAACDNFIVSGCEVNGTSISAGYVYLNGKLRYFSGATGISKWPQYLYESNRAESVAYASGSDKVGRNVYGCSISASMPTIADSLTGNVPQYIQIQKVGGRTLNDAFFGKYALLLNSSVGSQTIGDAVTFGNTIKVQGALSMNDSASLIKGEAVCRMFYDGNVFHIQSRIGTGAVYDFAFDPNRGYVFSIGGTSIISISQNGISLTQPLTVGKSVMGSVTCNADHIYNSGTGSDNGTLYINYKGYNDDNVYYRNTVIGNGKGNAIISINGKNSIVNLSGTLISESALPTGLVLKHSTLQQNNTSLSKIINWLDASDSQMAYVGFGSTADNVFYIHNRIANVCINGLSAVNLLPAIMENGVLLSNKYVQKTDLATQMQNKADVTSVYSKSDAESKFADKTLGLSQFITGSNTKETLRSQIGAIAIGALDDVPRTSKYLADMAKTETDKKKICENIGAARSGDFQPKIPDTGWIKISGTDLYARQIGDHVCVQGNAVTVHTGKTMFTLPNQISAPRYDVAFRASLDCNCDWGCKIAGGSKNCTVIYCNHHGKTISLSFSYMV